MTLVSGAPGRPGSSEHDDLSLHDGPVLVHDPATPLVRSTPTTKAAAAAAARATEHLRRAQHPDGYWKGELETNVTMDAEDVLLRHFLGILDPTVLAAAARRLRSQQLANGAWATFYGGPGELSATVEAYVALRLAGDDPTDDHMRAAASWAREHGGVEAARVFTHVWLAMVGRWDWDDLPSVPAELIFLPSGWPFSIWSFGCWARQTIVALSVISHHRPSRPLPFGIDELRSGRPAPHRPLGLLGTALVWGDKLLHGYDRSGHKLKALVRSAALREAERWIVARQEADGSWGGIQPPMVYSTIALVLQGYPLDHPVIAAALKGMGAFTIEDEEGRRIEACQSPVWDTALALVGLLDAGADLDDPMVDRARRWLLDQEVKAVGDWAVQRPGLAPGGWAFEFANVNYPDIDDTAEVVLALRRRPVLTSSPGALANGMLADGVLADGALADGACRRGVDWVVGMQSRDGGWGAFDADNTSPLPRRLPFFDFGEVIDPPTADVTAHVVEMLACEPGLGPEAEHAMRRGVDWLLRNQEPDGSWWGRWGVNYVYGTGAVLPALVAAGTTPGHPAVARGVEWLLAHQNEDGGWGEDLRSYVAPEWRGRGETTASQTAWALIGLLAAGHAEHPATRRGVEWLVAHQDEDGTWDEPWFTGTGFPWDFSLNYHLYRHVFPLAALGRYAYGTGPRPAGP